MVVKDENYGYESFFLSLADVFFRKEERTGR